MSREGSDFYAERPAFVEPRCPECGELGHADCIVTAIRSSASGLIPPLAPEALRRLTVELVSDVETVRREQRLRARIAAEIEAFADDHSDVSDAYRHAALIAKGTPGP